MKLTLKQQQLLRELYHNKNAKLYILNNMLSSGTSVTNIAQVTITCLVDRGFLLKSQGEYHLTEKAIYYLKGGFF